MKDEKTLRKPARVLRRQTNKGNSIISSEQNPVSLRCVFYELEDHSLATRFTAGEMQEGHGGILHGGFTAALLDEIMGRSVMNCGVESDGPVVTAEMTVQYLRPIPAGEEMCAYGRVERAEGRRRYAVGVVVDANGFVMAKGHGVYVMVNQAGNDTKETGNGIYTEEITEKDPKIL